MKKRAFFYIIAFLMIFPIVKADDLSINGTIQTNTQVKLSNGSLLYNSNDLTLKFEGSTDYYHYYSELNLTYSGKPDADNINDLFSKKSIVPISIDLKEAYIDLYSFIFPFLDVRIGKQIIVWGSADKINPTSNLSPIDYSNVLDFGNRLGIYALQTNFYVGSFTISGVYVPSFTPAILPSSLFQVEGNSNIEFPSQKLGISSQAALLLNFPVYTFDLSLSYYYGRSSIPSVYQIEINPLTQSVASTDLFFPKKQVIGLSISGSIFNIGTWFEAGYFIPDKYSMKTIASGVGTIISEDRSVDDPYIRYVAGLDYTFKSGVYINMQFIHGFDSETRKADLKDYIIARIEKSFFDDKVKISPFTFVLTSGNINNLKDNYGFGYIPEIYYYPVDNIELNLGAYILDGKGNNMIADMDGKDLLFIKAKVSF